MNKTVKRIFMILGIILAALAVIIVIIYFAVLRYPNLKKDPTIGKWYRVSDSVMKDSEGHGYQHCSKRAVKTRS